MLEPSALYLGAAWYPEQWDPAALRHDLRLMREAGLNAVRVGEFAWSNFEPAPGRYETRWMRDAMDLAHDSGIGVVLCTPTATPPVWLLRRHPEVGFVAPDGYRHRHGGRQHADYTHPTFRRYARAVADHLAGALGDHPALIAWQIDNELRGHQGLSISESAVAGWHAWLGARYGTIDALNDAWGTRVWSQHYDAFEDVPPPYPLPCYAHNFSLLTNYRRYMSDSACDFQREQVRAIRRHSNAPITHNSEDSVDEWDLTRDLDFAGTDTYAGDRSPADVHFRVDCFRRLKPGRRFWTMETGSEGTLRGELYPAGWLSCFAMVNYAGGAQGISYWPWRQQRAGMEIDHHAIVYACGRPGSGFPEVAAVGQLRRRLEPLLDTYRPAPAAAAFVRSETNGHYFFADRIAGLEPNFDYKGRLGEEYAALLELGLWRDVLYDQAPVEGYRIVFSPYLPHVSDEFLARMAAHVEAGGVWVAGPYCGYRERDHTVPTGAILGRLEARLGFTTRYWMPSGGSGVTLHPTADALRVSGPLHTRASMAAAVFEAGPDDHVLGTYDHPRLAGLPWGLVRPLGKGRVYLLGSRIEAPARTALYRAILEREGIEHLPLPPGVSRMPQEAPGGRKAWALANCDDRPHTIPLPAPGRDLLADDAQPADTITLAPFSVAWVGF